MTPASLINLFPDESVLSDTADQLVCMLYCRLLSMGFPKRGQKFAHCKKDDAKKEATNISQTFAL